MYYLLVFVSQKNEFSYVYEYVLNASNYPVCNAFVSWLLKNIYPTSETQSH